MSLRAPFVGLAAVALLGTVAACGGKRAEGNPSPSDAEGTWTFAASVPLTGGGIFVEGAFTAISDTVLLTVDGGYCIPAEGNLEFLRYRCPGLFVGSRSQQTINGTSFVFQRRRPAERARVTVYYSSSTRRQTCAQYATDSGGNRVCVRWSSEVVEVPGSQSAILKVTPVK